jgi:hypothetical protein
LKLSLTFLTPELSGGVAIRLNDEMLGAVQTIRRLICGAPVGEVFTDVIPESEEQKH